MNSLLVELRAKKNIKWNEIRPSNKKIKKTFNKNNQTVLIFNKPALLIEKL